MGPKCLDTFHAQTRYHVRRALIREARYPGSIPPELHESLNTAVRNGWIRLELDEVRGAHYGQNGNDFVLDLAAGKSLRVDACVLATGFAKRPPDTPIYRHLRGELGLPTAACGFPILEPSLEWSRGLFLSGDLAELELGPTSPNIIGAHNTWKRLKQVVRAA
jgi:hypothetical protein